MKELTHARILELMNYNPETGLFSRLGVGRRSNKNGGVGAIYGKGYIGIRVDAKRYLAHRLAWFYVHGQWPSSDLDHINLNKADNRIANLRLSTRQLNSANTAPRGKSGFKGVIFFKGRWRAQITINKKFHSLGLYATPEEAHEVYKVAAEKAFGSFSRMKKED